MPQPKLLLVDDKESILELLATILASYDISRASDGARALRLVESNVFDVVVTDVRMPGADGHEVLRAVKSYTPESPVVMLTAYATVADAVAAVKQGAYDYIEKPFDPDDLALIVARAADHRRRALLQATDPAGSFRRGVSVPYREAVEAARDRASREYLAALMREFNGCVTWAAERAGMDRVSLHRLLRRLSLHSEEFKNVALPAAPDTTAADPGLESPAVRIARVLGPIPLNGLGQGERRPDPAKARPPELPSITPIPN
jgi:DNA-binding NtrC family response regulator